MPLTIAEEHPLTADLELLFQRHTADMHADTPPESIHMMDKGALAAPGIRFFVMRDGGRPVAMGAFKRIDAGHAEIKSMHVLAEDRAGACRGRCWSICLTSRTGWFHPAVAGNRGAAHLHRRARALCAGGVRGMPAVRGLLGRSEFVFMTKTLG